MLAAPAAGVLALAGCSTGPDATTAVPPPVADGSPTPPPTEEPATSEPATVRGERLPGAHWVNATALLSHRTVEVGPGDTVLPAVHAVGDWLDQHLDDLQRGGEGHLAEVAPTELLAVATADDLAAVTTDLASPAAPVATATYRLDAAYDADTEWITATVEVTDVSGGHHAATLVFVPGDAGPELVLFGPASTIPPATPEDER